MESTGSGLHLISMVLFMAAAAAVYLFLLNRVLIQMRDARRKSLLIRAGGLLSVAVAGALGYFAAGTAWMLVPAAILAATALGEVRRLIVRRRCAGAPPVEVEQRRRIVAETQHDDRSGARALHRERSDLARANPARRTRQRPAPQQPPASGVLRGDHAPCR